MEPKIIYEDKSIFVCYKPPKWPVQSDLTGDQDMVTYLKKYMKEVKNFDDPYVGLVHRLDRPVSGLVVFAKNPKANHHLSQSLQDRTFKKTYLAIVEGQPKEETWCHYLKKKFKTNTSHVVEAKSQKSKKAILTISPLETIQLDNQVHSLVRIQLETGRHHQIRVQCAHMNHPLWGDTKYNPSFQNKKGWYQIALFAESVEFIHPKTKEIMSFKLPPKDYPFDQFKNL